MAKQDHVFLFTMENGKLGMAYCSMEDLAKEEARDAVLAALRQHKNYVPADLNYLGVMDYRNMDEGIKSQLHHFEKYNPVWLIMQK